MPNACEGPLKYRCNVCGTSLFIALFARTTTRQQPRRRCLELSRVYPPTSRSWLISEGPLKRCYLSHRFRGLPHSHSRVIAVKSCQESVHRPPLADIAPLPRAAAVYRPSYSNSYSMTSHRFPEQRQSIGLAIRLAIRPLCKYTAGACDEKASRHEACSEQASRSAGQEDRLPEQATRPDGQSGALEEKARQSRMQHRAWSLEP